MKLHSSLTVHACKQHGRDRAEGGHERKREKRKGKGWTDRPKRRGGKKKNGTPNSIVVSELDYRFTEQIEERDLSKTEIKFPSARQRDY